MKSNKKILSRTDILQDIKIHFLNRLLRYISFEYEIYCKGRKKFTDFVEIYENSKIDTEEDRIKFLDKELYKMLKIKWDNINILSKDNDIYINFENDSDIQKFIHLLDKKLKAYYLEYIKKDEYDINFFSIYSCINTDLVKKENEYIEKYKEIAFTEFLVS